MPVPVKVEQVVELSPMRTRWKRRTRKGAMQQGFLPGSNPCSIMNVVVIWHIAAGLVVRIIALFIARIDSDKTSKQGAAWMMIPHPCSFVVCVVFFALPLASLLANWWFYSLYHALGGRIVTKIIAYFVAHAHIMISCLCNVECGMQSERMSVPSWMQ